MSKKLFCTIIFFSLITQLFFTGCLRGSVNSDDYVVKINNELVFKDEFMVYLDEAKNDFESLGGKDIWETDFDGQTAEYMAKESALNGLKMVKITAQKAQQIEIELSAEEEESAHKEAEESFKMWAEEQKSEAGITVETLYKVMSEKALYSKVYKEITKNFELSEVDFDVYYQKNKLNFKKNYTEYTLMSILVKDEKTAVEVLQKASSGIDFNELVRQYEVKDEYRDNGGIINTYKERLESSFGIPFEFEKGEISDIMESDEGYYIFKVEDKKELSEEELIQVAKNYYTIDKEQQLFTKEYQKWLEDATVEKNTIVWDEIKVQ